MSVAVAETIRNEKSLRLVNSEKKKEISDEWLVQRTLDGDTSAYDVLVERYQQRIYHFVYRYVGDSQEAEDITQDVFVKAYKNLSKFRGDSKFSTWLFQIGKNMSINKLRTLKRKVNKFFRGDEENQEDWFSQIPSEERSAEEGILGAEAEVAVQAAILKINPTFRTALILRDIEYLAYEEISEILGVSVGTVKSRIHRARSELRTNLGPYIEQGIVVPEEFA